MNDLSPLVLVAGIVAFAAYKVKKLETGLQAQADTKRAKIMKEQLVKVTKTIPGTAIVNEINDTLDYCDMLEKF